MLGCCCSRCFLMHQQGTACRYARACALSIHEASRCSTEQSIEPH